MKRIRQACKLIAKEPEPESNNRHQNGSIHDQWGISPHHFLSPAATHEKATRGGVLRHIRSAPFFLRDATATGNLPTPAAPSQIVSRGRPIRKDSKIARLLGVSDCSEINSRNDTDVVNSLPGFEELISPPLLPIGAEADADAHFFSGRPPGQGPPEIQVQARHPAPQHAHQPASLASSLSERHAVRTRTGVSQSAPYFSVDPDAQRPSRSQLRITHAKPGTFSARSRSHPPPGSSGSGNPTGTSSQPPFNSFIINTSQHASTSAHGTRPVDALAPRVRDAAVTPRKCHLNKYDPAPTPAPHLRKSSSSVTLSKKPCAETLRILTESASMKTGYPNVQTMATVPVWPPAPVLRPLQIVMPPRAEQSAFRAAAIETDKAYCKICDDRGLFDRGRSDRGHPTRRTERGADPHRSRYHQVEYHPMADYGYYPAQLN
ncbi:hypothetical protein B0F90DRAFT_1698792 [Multifurca ochricompacta]|uniref:Uncharacterized protein n=1 Tax=Multifurca ochricompacta TaxID=376703 RepID=A0AAD4M808_9AGAM|nr:hypothetical protein B0F90DRAFT_1698792 [Multifurca ochricompacta]